MNNLIVIQGEDLKNLLAEVVTDALKTQQPPPPKKERTKLLTREQTANLLNISLPTLDRYTKDGKIPAYRIGCNIRFKEREVLKALKSITKYKRG